MSVLVELLQHSGQVHVGDEATLDLGDGKPLFEELESCLPVESSYLEAAAIDHLKHLLAFDVILIATRPEFHSKTLDFLPKL